MSLFCELERIFSLLRVGIEVKRGVYSPKSTSLGKANRLNSSVCGCVCARVRVLAHLMRGRGGTGHICICATVKEKKFCCILSSFFWLVWRSNDMRHINKRKPNLLTFVRGRVAGSIRIKDLVRQLRLMCYLREEKGRGLGLQSGGRQFTGRSKRINVWETNVCWAIWRHRKYFDQTGLQGYISI